MPIGWPGSRGRGWLFPRLAGPVFVAVPGVLGQDPPEVPVADDQQAVGALAAQRSRVALREGIRLG
jgi:hypothetical protein